MIDGRKMMWDANPAARTISSACHFVVWYAEAPSARAPFALM